MKTADEVKKYILNIPMKKRQGFKELHDTILAAAPEAESCISYSMPAIRLHGVVVYYACWENHMAIYPMPSAMREFAERLKGYVTSKSTVQFPHGAPFSKKLVKEIVEYRVRENILRYESKRNRK